MANQRQFDISDIQKRSLAEFFLETPDYFPTFSEIEPLAEATPSSVAANAKHLAEYREASAVNLDNLFRDQAERDLRDARNRYLAFSESTVKPCEDQSTIAEAHRLSQRPPTLQTSFSTERDKLTSAQAATILLIRKNDVEKSRPQPALPQTIDEYRALVNSDVKKRNIARFLIGSESAREKLVSTQGWQWRALFPLLEEYYSNPSFATEVQDFVKTFEVSDPRRRFTS